jgi:inosine-uridine nucleoside N-ribohydrolase
MRLIIDTDPGIDDALALLLALDTDGVEVLGISAVGGNTALHNTARNALRIVEFVGRPDIPVAAGCDTPYQREKRESAVLVHGHDGLGGAYLPEPVTGTVTDDAPAFLANLIRQHPDATLVTLGPLTNIAHMVDRFPDAVPARMVMMGGAAHLGNMTPVAEFNVWHDPEAAARVFDAGLNPVMVGLDATHSVKTYESDFEGVGAHVEALLAPMLRFYTDFYASVHGERMSHQHDAIAMAEAIWPGFLEQQPARIDVETRGVLTDGMTVVDVHDRASKGFNATVAWSAPAVEFHNRLRAALHSLNAGLQDA